ncbi:MAG: hypothetical protein QM796_17535 [Chthoniobacteraceae bacterium]
MAILIGVSSNSSPRDNTPSSQPTPFHPTPSPVSTPLAQASTPASRVLTVKEAQLEALRRYPALGVSGSRFNGEFLARYKRYQQNNPNYFLDPSWPIILADETANALKGK